MVYLSPGHGETVITRRFSFNYSLTGSFLILYSFEEPFFSSTDHHVGRSGWTNRLGVSAKSRVVVDRVCMAVLRGCCSTLVPLQCKKRARTREVRQHAGICWLCSLCAWRELLASEAEDRAEAALSARRCERVGQQLEGLL